MAMPGDSFELAMTEVGPSFLRKDAQKFSDPEHYVVDAMRRYRSARFMAYLGNAAEVIEPRDRVLGKDPNRFVGRAFFAGETLGYIVAREFMPPEAFTEMMRTDFSPGYGNDDDQQEAHDIIADIMDCGDRGYARAEAYHPLFDEWEDSLCHDVSRQIYTKRGFGLVVYMMQDASHRADLREMQGMLDQAPPDGLNWDSALQGLIDNQ